MSAIITRDAYQDDAGQLHLVSPLCFLPVPASYREAMNQAGKKAVAVPLPNLTVSFLLWGGRLGDTFTVGGTIKMPDGREIASLADQLHTWQVTPFYIGSYGLTGGIRFEDAVIYSIELALDGERLVDLPLAAYWEDGDTPP